MSFYDIINRPFNGLCARAKRAVLRNGRRKVKVINCMPSYKVTIAGTYLAIFNTHVYWTKSRPFDARSGAVTFHVTMLAILFRNGVLCVLLKTESDM